LWQTAADAFKDGQSTIARVENSYWSHFMN
jgi:hypothetical protein